MKQSSVKILYYNENASSIVASAGRISTTKGSAIELYDKSCEKSGEENHRLIQKILLSGHTSVLEHMNFNLAFDNVSVFVEQFMIEFRLASFTVKSRRYVDFGHMGYVSPDFDAYGEQGDTIRTIYRNHMEYLFQEYNDLLECGIPKEDARFILPYSFRSNFYCTVNARQLVKIVNEMVYGRGKDYAEIAALGRSLMDQCREIAPFLEFADSSSGESGFDIPIQIPKERCPSRDCTKERQESVRLLNGPDNPEEMICRAFLLESGYGFMQTADSGSETRKKILQKILSRSRKRELEQVNFTVLFQKISLAGITHLVRHRMQSIVIPDYGNACRFQDYIIPQSIVNAGLEERYTGIFSKSETVYEQLKHAGFSICDKVYTVLSGLTVPVMTTMNANELATFIRLRSCNRAQWEIRSLSVSLLEILRREYPDLFSLYGPTCYMTGKCPEGKMSCGQMEQIQKTFAMKCD